MYGSHPYSNPSGPPTTAPPPPEWRVSPHSPHPPPRQSWQSGVASPPPPPPPPPPPQYYDPNNPHGALPPPPPDNPAAAAAPIPGFTGVNTTTWGVNFNNRQNYMQTPPPLPPRPASTTGHPANATQSPIVNSANSHHAPIAPPPSYGSPPPPVEYHQQWGANTNAPYLSQQPINSVAATVPPPPPPIPFGYQSPVSMQNQQTWQQPPPPSSSTAPPNQYHPPPPVFNHPGSPPPVLTQHTPPPPLGHPGPEARLSQHISSQQVNSIMSAPVHPEPQVFHTPAPDNLGVAAPPVPPKTSPLIIPTGASALGTGGPSDWEHLSPVLADVDDTEIFRPKKDTGNFTNAVHELPPSQPAPPPSMVPRKEFTTPPPNPVPQAQAQAQTPYAETQNYQMNTPVSPGTAQTYHDPLPPTRVDTTGSDFSTVSAVANSESIDGVIEAWNRPLSAESKTLLIHQSPDLEPELEPVSPQRTPSPFQFPAKQPEPVVSEKGIKPNQSESGARVIDNVTFITSEPVKKTATSSPSLPQQKPIDPYEDLDPWSRSSLERYTAMIRKEAVADSDEERYKIFTAFMTKETKLREILYNIEHEAKSSADTPVQQPSPAPQPSSEPAEKKETTDTPEVTVVAEETDKPEEDIGPVFDSGLIPVESEQGYFAPAASSGGTGDGGYSPGGRPILPKLHTPQPPSLHRSLSNPSSHKYGPSFSIPSLPSDAPRATSVPPTMHEVQRTVMSPLVSNPPQRIYTPFRYIEGPQRGSDQLAFDRPAYQAYSALRLASAESGRVMAPPPTPAPTPGARNRSSSVISAQTQNDQDETFVGLIREKSVAYRKKNRPTASSSSPPPPLPAALRQGKSTGSIEELRSMVSSPSTKQLESLWHTTARKDLEKYSNDFSYMREQLKPWELKNKPLRENLDKERLKRQEESEGHIDALFNEKEIGYADINVLEEEFRQKEARAQLEEERLELEDFIEVVFNPLDKRLEEEISVLRVHYESALGQLDRESKSKDSSTDKSSLSHTMKIVNEVYHKLEIRHHKRFEIAVDRERRRKKAERRPLVFMGDSPALKRLDSEFDQMEKQNILEAARDRDDRANRLIDTFDAALIHGLGENQSLLDEIAAKVGRMDEAAIRSSGLTESEIEQVLKSTHSLVESLRKDSESILHNFGIADSALNNADYSVSVAEARYANAEADVFRQLDAEKRKEDTKIQNNLRTKLRSVRVGPTKITASINDTLQLLGKPPITEPPRAPDVIPTSNLFDTLVTSGPVLRPPSTTNVAARKGDDDPDYEERMRKALEAAKKRNAARTHPLPSQE